MHEAAEQMREGMPVGLGGEFEYRGGERRTHTTVGMGNPVYRYAKTRSAVATASIHIEMDESARCGPASDEPECVQDNGCTKTARMKPSRGDPAMQARLMKMAKSAAGGSAGGSQPWTDGGVALGAYYTAVKRILKVDVVEGLFTEEMGYSGMTMSALEDQLKVEEELEQMRGRMEEEEKRNTKLVAANEKLRGERRELSRELSAVQKKMEEANQKIDAFTTELRTCYEDAVADFIGSAEYEEKMAAQRVEGYFNLAEKVGEKYPSLDWSFLDVEAEGPEAEQAERTAIPNAESVTEDLWGLTRRGALGTVVDFEVGAEGPEAGTIKLISIVRDEGVRDPKTANNVPPYEALYLGVGDSG
ncbi:unnamed protein product [Prunus brigantina]